MVMVDALLLPPPILALGGTGGISIMLPLYRGPMSLSLTLLFRRGMAEICGSAANLSTLSDPSAFFSPARIARSWLMALLCAFRRRDTNKNTMPTMMATTTMAITIPRPVLAPDVKARFDRVAGIGVAEVVRISV